MSRRVFSFNDPNTRKSKKSPLQNKQKHAFYNAIDNIQRNEEGRLKKYSLRGNK